MPAERSDSERSDPLDEICLRLLVGPTAVGKSALAMRLCEATGAEIVSLDAMQVYRGMDVGTAKPTREERERVRHHMLDLVEPSERYDVRRYLADLRAVARDVRDRGARALFVGGSGFYVKALLQGLFEGPAVDAELRGAIEARVAELGARAAHAELARVDPETARRVHPNDTKRVVRGLEVFEQTGRPLSAWQREWGWHGAEPRARAARIIRLALPTPELDRRIALRTREMLEAGWVEEALAVRSGPGFGPTASQALGYAEVLAHADGELTREECVEIIALRTRQFARRQRTWFKKLVADETRALVERARAVLGL